MELHTFGIDLGKTVFHLVGLNLRGEVVVRKRFSRSPVCRQFDAPGCNSKQAWITTSINLSLWKTTSLLGSASGLWRGHLCGGTDDPLHQSRRSIGTHPT